jgi:hypothetical protein
MTNPCLFEQLNIYNNIYKMAELYNILKPDNTYYDRKNYNSLE